VQVSTEPFAIAYFQVRPLPLPAKDPSNLTLIKIKRGQKARISWKVTGLVTDLTMEPAVANFERSTTGSVDVTPDRDTVYKLTAKSGNRSVVSPTVKIEVKK
jgi:hypothetical protein